MKLTGQMQEAIRALEDQRDWVQKVAFDAPGAPDMMLKLCRQISSLKTEPLAPWGNISLQAPTAQQYAEQFGRTPFEEQANFATATRLLDPATTSEDDAHARGFYSGWMAVLHNIGNDTALLTERQGGKS